ncbi:MAG: methyl-accepting chemotaxis protein [Planctomycetaceae bacterium]|jgi:methyl-accepting chemotaxis protein|nr:methyl-accepting chemotaxis protein [Planctomycetaceae bacterium]
MFNKLRIGTKLILGFGTVIILLTAITIITAYSYSSITRSTHTVVGLFEASTHVNESIELANQMRRDVLVYMSTHDTKLVEEFDKELNETAEKIKDVKTTTPIQENVKIAENILAILDEVKKLKDAYILRENKVSNGHKEYFHVFDQLEKTIDETSLATNKMIRATASKNEEGEELMELSKLGVIELLQECESHLGEIAILRYGVVYAVTDEERERISTNIQVKMQELVRTIEEVRPQLPEGDAAKSFAKFIELRSKWLEVARNYMADIQELNNSQSILLLKLADSIKQSGKLLKNNFDATFHEGENQAKIIAFSKYVGYTVAGIAMLTAIAMGWLLSRSVAGGISGIVEIFRRITQEGDTNANIGDAYLKRTDEVGELAQQARAIIGDYHSVTEAGQAAGRGDWTYRVKIKSEKDTMNQNLANMFEQVNDVLNQVQGAVLQVTIGTGQVAATSETLSQGATESAASLEEITSSMTEMGSQTHQNAQNAAEASHLAKDASEAAGNGQQMMQQMINSMEQITKNSQDVQKVIKVIDDISFQTNLLALNAAVEAARAGVHGKGFAVVAEEVRNLAARCAKAAGETTQMIENNNRQINEGAEIAQKTAEMLDQIVSHVANTTNLINEIATASNEQAQGVSQVSQALQQIDSVTQQNTASAEESASASSEMNNHATRLQQVVSRFKLRNANTNGGNTRSNSCETVLPNAENVSLRNKKKISGNSPTAKRTAYKFAGSSEERWGGGAATAVLDEEPNYNFKLDDTDFGKY